MVGSASTMLETDITESVNSMGNVSALAANLADGQVEYDVAKWRVSHRARSAAGRLGGGRGRNDRRGHEHEVVV
jgi:hypothetical protein